MGLNEINVYLAAPWKHRDQAREAKKAFEEAGFTVTANWIDGQESWDYDALGREEYENRVQKQAIEDVENIIDSDIFVILNLDFSDGKATELGFAYGLQLPVILVGDRTRNIFYHLPGIIKVDTIEAAIAAAREVEL